MCSRGRRRRGRRKYFIYSLFHKTANVSTERRKRERGRNREEKERNETAPDAPTWGWMLYVGNLALRWWNPLPHFKMLVRYVTLTFSLSISHSQFCYLAESKKEEWEKKKRRERERTLQVEIVLQMKKGMHVYPVKHEIDQRDSNVLNYGASERKWKEIGKGKRERERGERLGRKFLGRGWFARNSYSCF